MSPVHVNFSNNIVDVACTRGQPDFKGGHAAGQNGGGEGPHTLVVDTKGQLFTFGTCHKGNLLNLGNKTGGFGFKDGDELEPYLVGSALKNKQNKPPVAAAAFIVEGETKVEEKTKLNGGETIESGSIPLCCWPPPYTNGLGLIQSVTSGHIHSTCIDQSGRAWSWGCGSNDGRAGVERFLNMSGEGKPPKVDAMKCYMMNPHRVGVAREKYWKYGASLKNVKVIMLATGRNHMACIGVQRN